MKLSNQFIQKLHEHINNKLINMQQHPTLPLRVFKYSKEAQYQCKFDVTDYEHFSESNLKEWDEVLLMCRGLIVDVDYNVVAKGFDKFFNLEEVPADELSKHSTLPYQIFEKLDGSLGIVFYYANERHIATQGSFTSEQAVLAKHILSTKYSNLHMNPQHVYLVEITSPLNRIVLHYPESDLQLLAVLDAANNFAELDLNHNNVGFTQVQAYNLPLSGLKQLEWENHEGFVVRYADGFRYKVKFAEYLRLHHVMTGLSDKHVLAAMVEDKFYSQTLEDVGDEFYGWLHSLEARFLASYAKIEQEIKLQLNLAQQYFTEKEVSRKGVAIYLKSLNSKHFGTLISLFFNEIDDVQLSTYIWKLVENERKEYNKQHGRIMPTTFFSNND